MQIEETICFIEYNLWKLYKPNTFDFDNNRLEVKDKQNNLVFSTKYEEINNTCSAWISGYFIDPSSIIVLPNDPKRSKSINPLWLQKTDSKWRQEALEEISVIKSIF